MTSMIWLLLFLLAVPTFICSANAVFNRCPGARPHKTPFAAGKYANLILIPIYSFLHVRLFGSAIWPMVAGLTFLLIYLNALVFLNWFVFTLTDVSMHIQLMMQMAKAGSITSDELVGRYNKDTILGNRVPRLLELGQLKLVNGRLYVTGGSVLFGSSVCQVLRRILGIPLRPEDVDHSS